ncbi:SgcJ/EcaC family oxidoreductase [Neorhodopirellula lusitana]|uniref:SgcJ/EcaC family oxidoreductase n=1 Tax=Neorhodopirellula lusitana TaxID=445327 RepID=UPI00384D72ED
MYRFTASCLLLVLLHSPVFADETAIRTFVQQYAADFNAKNASELTQKWVSDGQYRDLSSGLVWTGRDEIAKQLEIVLSGAITPRLQVTIDAVRMIGESAARVEGTNTIELAVEDAASGMMDQFEFVALVVLEDGSWRFNNIDERAIGDAAQEDEAAVDRKDFTASLSQLAWLQGEWRDDIEGVNVTTSVRALPGGQFLLRVFSREVEDAEPLVGFQVIGHDPNADQIRSWSFFGDGSFGEGEWQVGDEETTAMVQSRLTSAEGVRSAGTYVIRQVDDNTLNVKLFGRSVAGEPLPNGVPVTVVRVDSSENGSSEPTIQTQPIGSGE